MTRSLLNHLLFFIAGSVVALGAVAAFDHAPGHLGAIALGSWFWSASPVFLASIAILILGTTLYVSHRNEAGAPSAPTVNVAAAASGRPARGQREVNAVRDELDRQLGRLIVFIAGHLKNSEDHVASLKDANESLSSVSTVEEMRTVVQSLIARNQDNESETRTLEARLKEAQEQAEKLKQRLNQAEKLASLDPLTSVANRRRFEQFIAAEVDGSHESGTPLCLVMTDIDHFKNVNDTHGHAAGDRVLKSFAHLLSKCVRGGDLVARYGGEEFAILTDPNYGEHNRAAVVIAGQLQEIGIDAQVRQLDWPTVLQVRLTDEGWNGWTLMQGVEPFLGPYGFASLMTGERPHQRETHPRLTSAYEALVTGATVDDRKAAFAELQEAMYDLVPQIKIGDVGRMQAGRSSVHGFEPFRAPRVYNVWLEE